MRINTISSGASTLPSGPHAGAVYSEPGITARTACNPATPCIAKAARAGRAWGALIVGLLAAATARGQGQPIASFADLPNGTFLDVVQPPNCDFPMPTITVPITGRNVVMTTTRGADMTQPYRMGCFNWNGVVVNLHLPINPAVNPGDFRGHYQETPAYGDLILDFSEPLTGFGISSMLETVTNSNAGDTIIVYDGPTATGNVLGTATTQPPPSFRLRVDFIGVVVPTAQIRSARILMAPSFCIDGYAVAVASVTCPSVTLHPAAASACPSGAASFSVTAAGTAPFTYQWQRADPGAPAGWSDLADGPLVLPAGAAATVGGSHAATLTLDQIRLNGEDFRDFRCIITNACGSAASNPATLTLCIADVNCDHQVTPADIAIFVNTWITSLQNGTLEGDMNGDGVVSPTDIAIYVNAWFTALISGGC